MKKLDPCKLSPVAATCLSRKPTQQGELTLVNTRRNGRRLKISNDILENLGNPTTLRFSLDNNGIAIHPGLPDSPDSFPIRTTGKQQFVYSSHLVQEITQIFGLDFSNRTSITFYDAYFFDYQPPIAYVLITPLPDSPEEPADYELEENSLPEIE